MLHTLKYAKMLEETGLTREQAETHVYVLSEAIGENLVTKQDLKSVETGLYYKIDEVEIRLNAKIDSVEAKIETVETRLNHKIDKFESNMRHEMEKLQNQLIIKLGIMMFSLFGGSVALGGLALAYAS